LRKYHFKATLTEEGTSSLHITKEKRLRMTISWSRSIDITDKLTPQQKQKIKQLAKKRDIAYGEVKKKRYHDIIEIILENRPRLLEQETSILEKIHKNIIDLKVTPIKPVSIHVSKDSRISVKWRIEFKSKKLIDLLCTEYGMLKETWKNQRLQKQYETYKKYRSRKLINNEITKIKETLKEIPPKIPKKWTKTKINELFKPHPSDFINKNTKRNDGGRKCQKSIRNQN
ncbi:MAG: hypothetical protein NDF54_05330, partial [archaeon GB-1867-035]|nr:hypothetical protein [Candidatus Culexmicrobium profundum]